MRKNHDVEIQRVVDEIVFPESVREDIVRVVALAFAAGYDCAVEELRDEAERLL